MSSFEQERTSRAQIARDTVAIVERGHYLCGDLRVEIGAAVDAAVRGSEAFAPSTLAALHADVAPRWAGEPARARVEITGETTLGAARRLVADGGRVLCLNFASAKNPGGGFLSGARAQEESLCRGSALYATLVAQVAYYDANRACRDLLYTDWAIYSPRVPVLRDDDEQLLAEPVLASFVTMPAPNRGAMRERDEAAIAATLRRRIGSIFAIAADRGYRRLVLGAWGCGAFRNDPAAVAAAFREVVDSSAWRSAFDTLVFAIFEAARDQGNRAAFETAFGARSSVTTGAVRIS